MKKVKKRYKILIGVLIVILLIPPFQFFVLKDSVMEDIYRSVYRNYYAINKMEGICPVTYESIEGNLWMGSYIYCDYDDEYLKEGFEISLYIPPKEDMNFRNILITCLVTIDNNVSIRIGMKYEHKTRTMVYENIYLNVDEEDSILSTQYFDEENVMRYLSEYGITKEDIKDYQHYILYDVVYQSWVSGTDNGRKLNKWDYYNIKEVDNTFNFEEESYEQSK